MVLFLHPYSKPSMMGQVLTSYHSDDLASVITSYLILTLLPHSSTFKDPYAVLVIQDNVYLKVSWWVTLMSPAIWFPPWRVTWYIHRFQGLEHRHRWRTIILLRQSALWPPKIHLHHTCKMHLYHPSIPQSLNSYKRKPLHLHGWKPC